MHLSQVRGASKNVVVRIKGIDAKAMAVPQIGPGIGHDLHEAHCARRRDGAYASTAFQHHDGIDPGDRHTEALRSLSDEVGKWIRSSSPLRLIQDERFGVRGASYYRG